MSVTKIELKIQEGLRNQKGESALHMSFSVDYNNLEPSRGKRGRQLRPQSMTPHDTKQIFNYFKQSHYSDVNSRDVQSIDSKQSSFNRRDYRNFYKISQHDYVHSVLWCSLTLNNRSRPCYAYQLALRNGVSIIIKV